MLAVVLAMVVLSSPDPDPVATSAAASLASRLPGAFDAASLARGDMSASDASFGDVRVAPFCSYGASAVGGVTTLGDAAAMASTLAEPACESSGFAPGAGFGPLGFAAQGFESGFGTFGEYGAFSPVRFTTPLRPVGFAGAAPGAAAAYRPPVTMPAAPAMLQSQPAVHLGAAPAGGAPAAAQGGGMRSGAPIFRVMPGLFGAVAGGAFDRATHAAGPSMRTSAPVMRMPAAGVRAGGVRR